jgi:hypothetical protein
MRTPKSSRRSFAKLGGPLALVASNASSQTTAYKKKLHRLRPRADGEPITIETRRTKKQVKKESADPTSLERGVRTLLAEKVSGALVGIWLLAAEHLRLGTWDLLCGWTGQPTECIQPRLALQLVHEAALCTAGVRSDRCLTQQGFELANGLPFLATDSAIHHLLAEHTVEECERLQVTLGKLRQASEHFRGRWLAVDPHRTRSYSQRQMRRHQMDKHCRPAKTCQTFWLLDADTHEPVCFTIGTSSRTVVQATPPLLDLAAQILPVDESKPALILADAEHFSRVLAADVYHRNGFDLLTPMSQTKSLRQQLASISPDQFTPRWAGYATAKLPYQMRGNDQETYWQYAQRFAERPDEWAFKAYLCTADRDEVEALTEAFPDRWHVEEFFHANQALGWKRAGTLNLNIRYGRMTMALLAQTVIAQLRQRVGEPLQTWDADHLAIDLFSGLDGDVRVMGGDTVLVTYYNAPNVDILRQHYEGLPSKLEKENIDPRVPWLYNFKLDFRFR